MKINKVIKIISLLLVSLSVCSCMNENEFLSGYEKYNTYEISGVDFYNQNSEHYFIYMYSNSCPPCNDMKTTLFSVLDRNPKNLFIINVKEMSDEIYNSFKNKKADDDRTQLAKEMIGASSISETYILFTPSIYEIKTEGQSKQLIKYTFDYSSVEQILLGSSI